VAYHSINKYWKLSKGLICFLLVLLLISCSKPLLKESVSDSSDVGVAAPVVKASYPDEPVPEPRLSHDPEFDGVEVADIQEPEIVSAPVPAGPIDLDIAEAEIAPDREPVEPSVVNVPGPEIFSKPVSKPIPKPVPPEPPAEIPLPQNGPAPLVPEVAKVTSVPVAAIPVEATLDLDKLGTRLRQTKAIGLFTKLELKSQVEDLLDEMEEYHESKSSLDLEQLEEHFNLLVMKLLLLLQDDDPQLHKEIARSRPVLWSTLADPNQFSSMKGI